MIQLDLIYLIQTLTPPILRSPILLNYLVTCMSGVNDVLQRFYSFRAEVNYDLTWTGQVIYLEHLLNDQFDEPQRRITITNIVDVPFTFVFNQFENNPPLYIYNQAEQTDTYLYNQPEYSNNSRFIINIPGDVIFDENLLRSLVNRYKLASKTYIINIV